MRDLQASCACWRTGRRAACAAVSALLCAGAVRADHVVTNSLHDVILSQWMDRDNPHVDSAGSWAFSTKNYALVLGQARSATAFGLHYGDYPFIYADMNATDDSVPLHPASQTGPMYVAFKPAVAGTYRAALEAWAGSTGDVLVYVDNGFGTNLTGTAAIHTRGSSTHQSTVSDWLELGTGDTMRLVMDCAGDQSCDSTTLRFFVLQRKEGDLAVDTKKIRFSADTKVSAIVSDAAREALAGYAAPATASFAFTQAIRAARAAEANPITADELLGTWKFMTYAGTALVNWMGSATGSSAGIQGTAEGEYYPWFSGDIATTNAAGLAVGEISVHPGSDANTAMRADFSPAKPGWYRFDYAARRTNLSSGGNGVRVGAFLDAPAQTWAQYETTRLNGGWVHGSSGWRFVDVTESFFLNVDPNGSYSYDGSGLKATVSYRAASAEVESCSLADMIRAAYAQQANPVSSDALLGTWLMAQANGVTQTISTTSAKFLAASGQQYQHFSANSGSQICGMHPPNNHSLSHVIAFTAEAAGWYRFRIRARGSSTSGDGVKITAYGATTSDTLVSFVTTRDTKWTSTATAWRQLAVGDTLHICYDMNGSDGYDSTETDVRLERTLAAAPPSETLEVPLPSVFTNGAVAVTLGGAASVGATVVPFAGFDDRILPWYVWQEAARAVPSVLANVSGGDLADPDTGYVYATDELRLRPGAARCAAVQVEVLPAWTKRNRCDFALELRSPNDASSLASLGESCYVYLNGTRLVQKWAPRNATTAFSTRVGALAPGDVVTLYVKSTVPEDSSVSADEVAARIVIRREQIPGAALVVE